MTPEDRDIWKDQMMNGTFKEPHILYLYRKHRNSDFWHSSTSIEQLCEYILYLEVILNYTRGE